MYKGLGTLKMMSSAGDPFPSISESWTPHSGFGVSSKHPRDGLSKLWGNCRGTEAGRKGSHRAPGSSQAPADTADDAGATDSPCYDGAFISPVLPRQRESRGPGQEGAGITGAVPQCRYLCWRGVGSLPLAFVDFLLSFFKSSRYNWKPVISTISPLLSQNMYWSITDMKKMEILVCKVWHSTSTECLTLNLVANTEKGVFSYWTQVVYSFQSTKSKGYRTILCITVLIKS